MTKQNKDTNTLEEQLNETTGSHTKYIEDLNKLKEIFYDLYDDLTIVSLLEVIKTIGHPTEKTFAEEFKKEYKSGNFSEVEIKIFRDLYRRYQTPLINKLNGEDWK